MVGRDLKRGVVMVAMLAALVFVGAAAPSAPTPPADQATAYQLDATHDGSMADAGFAAPLTQAWSVTLPGASSYPLIADGMLFVTTANKMLYVLNQATGATIWSRAAGSAWSGLAYDRGQLFLVNHFGLLTAFDAATGSIAWTEQLPLQYDFTSAPTAINGIVYTVGTGVDGTVYAVRETDGHLLWTQSMKGGRETSPAVTAQGAYVASCQRVYDFDPLTGSQLFQYTTGCVGSGMNPVVASGHVFTREIGGPNIIVSASTGAKEGEWSQGTTVPAPAVANGVAFMRSGSTLSAVAGAGLGSASWTFTGDGQLDTAPIVIGGLVYVGSSSGNLYALDPTTGATTWSTNVGAGIPAPDENNVSQPLTGLGAANGTLVVPAGSKLVAYRSGGAITNAPSNQSPPSVDGSAGLDENEAADVGIWSGLPSAYAYQWEQCDSSGANCADIEGATGPSYLPTPDDYGMTVRVRVVATNGIGSSAPIESAASAVLGLSSAPPVLSTSPAVSGTATVGQQLSTTNGRWRNSATSYAYQWQRCDDTLGSNCVDIPSATSSQYMLVADDNGYYIRSKVLASNGIGPAPGGYAPSASTGVVVLAGTPTITTAPSDQATAYQMDPPHDGSIADAGLAAPLTQAWSITLPGSSSYPVIADGMVFVTAANEMVYALNQATGATVWSHSIGGTFAWSGLAYDRGQVFVANHDNVLTAFDAATGTIDWSETLPGQSSSTSAPSATNGIVYAVGEATIGGTVYAVRESDGALLWKQPGVEGDQTSPAVTADGVYESDGCHLAWDFDPLLGTVLWHQTQGTCTGGFGPTPVVANGHFYGRDHADGNVILSASTGAIEASFDADPAPAVANGVAFTLSQGTLSAVAGAGIGNVNWTFTGDGNLDSAPIVVGGLVFEGSAGGHLYALDAATGATSWSTTGVSTNAPDEHGITVPLTGLAAANGTLVVPEGSTLVAYRTAGAITSAPSNQSLPRVDGPADLNGIEAVDVGIWSGLPSVYGFQWELCDGAGANCQDIAGATGTTYVPPAADVGVGATLRVRVVATNGVGPSAPVESTPSATAPLVLADYPTSHRQALRAGVVPATSTVGEQLSTTNGIWTNDPTSYVYKWQRCDSAGRHCSDIAGATSPQYTLVSADAGHDVRSEVRAINAVGEAATYAPSSPTTPVGGLTKPTLLSSPVVTGAITVGSVLSTTTGSWAHGPTSYAYRWQRCSSTGLSCVTITSATGSHHTLVTADAGHEIRSEVLASNGAGPAASGYAPSAPTGVVIHKPVVITLPKLSGIATVGNSLSVSNGTWKYVPTSYTYQWLRCTSAGLSCKKIVGATSSSYLLTAADAGHKLKAKVKASNAAGSSTATTSPSATVQK